MENEDFVKWANENVVVLVAHADKGHDPVEEENAKGEKVKMCPLYQGLTCEQHQQAEQDLYNAPEGLPKVKQPEGVPYSCMIAPDGTVHEFEKGADRQAGSLQDAVTELQKGFGKPLTWDKYEAIHKAFADADAAVEKSDWKAALKAYAELDKGRKKAPQPVVDQLDAKLKSLDEKLAAAWTEIKDGSGDLAAKTKAANDLLGKVKQSLSTGYPAVKAEIETWLKENKPAPKK